MHIKKVAKSMKKPFYPLKNGLGYLAKYIRILGKVY